MKIRPTARRLVAVAALLAAGATCRAQDTRPPDGITVRPGYELSVAVTGVSNPRFMEVNPGNGTLYISRPRAGMINACRDTDGDGFYETITEFVTGYPTVHGLEWHDGWLWFTQTGAIHRARDTNDDGRADEIETIIPEGSLPSGGGHWWRPILIHNGRIYTGIGDSGNTNDEYDTKRQKLFSFALDGSDERLFVSGTRNTEKLVVRPGTDEIWGMDHGSDNFGRELERRANAGQPITNVLPPDEMNHYVEGQFYGHPYIVGNRLPRYEYMDRPDIVELAARTVPPAWATGAHWAPNAMTFYDGEQFPEDVRGDAFVAYHGSWNREDRAGYCVTRVFFDNGCPYGELKYVDFLGQNGQVIGRPVDVVVDRDGTLLISDDAGDRVYRLRYTGTPNEPVRSAAPIAAE